MAKKLKPSMGELMSLPEGSPAKTLVAPANELELQKTPEADYGLKSPDFLANYDQLTSSWRTSQHCLLAQLNSQADGLAVYSETWPRSGMMQNGTAYQLPPLAPLIGETVSGSLLPTPDCGKVAIQVGWKAGRAKVTASENGTRKSKLGSSIYWCEDYLNEAEQTGGEINPEWLEVLMDFPVSWSEVEDLEMQSSHISPK